MAEVILPQLGARLGQVDADWVELSTGDLTYYDKANGIALVPVSVLEEADGEATYQVYRRHAPSDRTPASDADIGATILLVDAEQTASSNTQPGDAALDVRYYRVAKAAPRALWQGAHGVLVLLLYDVDIALPAEHGPIAAGIAAILANQDPRRCILPSSAIVLAEDNGHKDIPHRSVAARASRAISPTPAAPEFCFALGSCQYTAGLVDGTPRSAGSIPGPADKSYARLAQRLKGSEPSERPQLLILAGDQVYVDGTAGLFDPAANDGRFRRPYEQFFNSPFVQDIRRQIQVCMMIDDHEIVDNFENDNDEYLALGRAAYIEFQRDVGPLPPPRPVLKREPSSKWATDVDQGLWCAVKLGGYDFFFADSRTERQKRTAADFDQKHMLGRRQLGQLLHWLDSDNPDGRPRFVVSPSILLPRKLSTLEHPASALLSDAWDGYPRSQHLLLRWMARRRISDVIFLSGDEHRCCTAVASCDATDPPTVVRSVHCSGMYAPFPFANAIPEDFAQHETLTTGAQSEGSRRTWSVSSTFLPAGQGFGVIHVLPEADRWTVKVTFDLDSGRQSESFAFERPSGTPRKR